MKHLLTVITVLICGWLTTGCNNTSEKSTATSTKDSSESIVSNTSAPAKRDYFSVRLNDGFIGNGTKGSYSIYLDSTLKTAARKATIKSLKPVGDEFATVLSSSAPVQSLGKRVQLTGYIKSENVTGWAGLWMRVDSKSSNEQSTAFDNMQDRAVKGTTGWTKYSVVLDVATNAGNIVYGALVAGEGQIWLDSLEVKIVDKSVPVTNMVGKTL
jgi:hypothetical protein